MTKHYSIEYYKEKIKEYHKRMISFLGDAEEDQMDIKISCAGYLTCMIDFDLMPIDFLNELSEYVKTL
jgi:hypothetical protein